MRIETWSSSFYSESGLLQPVYCVKYTLDDGTTAIKEFFTVEARNSFVRGLGVDDG